MVIYIAFITLIGGLCFLSLDKKHYKVSSIIVFILYVIFVGFRFETGFDWIMYTTEFKTINFENTFLDEILRISKKYSHEPFYVIIVYWIKFFFKDFFFITFLTSLLLYYSYKKIAQEFKININLLILSLLLYLLFTVHFSLIRQSLAIAFFNFAIVQWNKKDIKYTVLLLIVSFLFHFSAIIYISLFTSSVLLTKYRGRKLHYKLFLGLLMAGVFLPRNINFGDKTRIGRKLNFYFSYDFDVNILEVTFTIVFYISVLLLIAKIIKKLEDKYLWMANFVVLSIIVSISFISINTFRNRIFYQMIVVVAIIVLTYGNTIFWRKELQKTLFLMFGLTLYIASIVKFYGIAYIPYQSYFQVWFFDDYGNGEERHRFIRYTRHKQKAIDEGCLEEYYEKLNELKKEAGIDSD